MSNIGSRTADTASAAGRRVSSMTDAAWDAGRHLADGSSIGRVFRDQPLLFGAIGVAIGAAIAAAIPQTQIEREYVGPTSDALKEQAQRAVQEHYEQMKQAAVGAMSTARQEMDRQFDSADDVVRNAGERLTGAADRVMGAVEKGVDRAKSELGGNDTKPGPSGGQKSAAASSPAMGGSRAGPQSTGTIPGNSSAPSRSV